ncbi:hypothetical protein AKJ09_06399 [Labilithrix luteola]|uniref:Uncharacterized protein n=1 Tax=Labilithrix luteola TaxID=1391654 RepID=A0A0K1Q1S4_9BACT|nr:hypothetical protein AKJ09_06399 [Labilithrix luteola]
MLHPLAQRTSLGRGRRWPSTLTRTRLGGRLQERVEIRAGEEQCACRRRPFHDEPE